MKNIKINILQPCLPKYRIPFFNKLIAEYQTINFYSSKVDHLGVRSAVSDLTSSNVYLDGKEIILPMGFLFQTHILNKEIYNADLLIINGNIRYISNYILIFLCKLYKTKVIWWGQAGKGKFTIYVRKLISKLCDGFLLYTDDEKKNYSNLRIPIEALNNGLDFNSISKFVKKDKETNDIINLIFIGRNSKKSRLNLLIDAVSDIRVSDKVKLYIVGDKEIYERNNIISVGEIYDENIISLYMNKSDVFIYPGNVGLSIIHAFCYGLPAIIHDNRDLHMPEVSAFENNVNGFSFKYGDKNSLVETILKAYHNKKNGELDSLSESAYLVAKNIYNIDEMTNRFISIVNRVANK
ncbi:TPA: glycosyltransferase [Photobacterium damselae]